MPLELRKQRDGRLRDSWYGRYEINGKRFVLGLGLRIRGTPPESLSLMEKGDSDFECSRVAAQAKLDQIVEEARSKRDSAHLVERLYEIKTGEKVRSVKLADLEDEWVRMPRRRKLKERYAKQWKSVLRRLAEFVVSQNPKADEISHVTRQMAQGFMEAEIERGVGAQTWNVTLKMLRSAFKYLLPAGAVNPFYGMVTKETDTVFRRPFTPEELKAVLDTAKDDDFIRPILVTGICTALRRGDCCLLKWKDVDLSRRFITVKTSKSGQTVGIPIFPLLLDELRERAENGKLKAEIGAEGSLGRGGTRPYQEEELVFPDQAAMYRENPDGITWRVKKVLAVALRGNAESGKARAGLAKAEMKLAEVSEAEARRRGHEFIEGLGESEKGKRMLAVFDAYMDGKKMREIVTVAGVSKGSVSGYLNEIEGAVGCRIVRGRPVGGSLTAALKSDDSLLRVRRTGSKRRASVRDFHSFRVTWVTLALTAGVPLELVQKVTGHKTTDIVLKHYFQPGREDFRQTLQSAMPKLLTSGKEYETTDHGLQTESEVGGRKSEDGGRSRAKEEMREMLDEVKPKALRERMLKVWAKLQYKG